MNEDERRDLIARQHRALYGNDSSMYSPDGSAPRQSQDARLAISGAPRGPSPLAFDPFGIKAQGGADPAVQMPPRDQGVNVSERRSSPAPAAADSTTFGMTESAQQATRNAGSPSNSSPSVPQGAMPPSTSSGVAPIGTRPAQQQAATSKRSTTPNERATPAAPSATPADKSSGLGGWGSSSGVWGPSKNTLGVQASVWG